MSARPCPAADIVRTAFVGSGALAVCRRLDALLNGVEGDDTINASPRAALAELDGILAELTEIAAMARAVVASADREAV